MSLYNRCVDAVEEVCPNCGNRISRTLQFKYGDVERTKYRVGDRLAWGGNDIGSPDYRFVRVSGHPEPCPVCGNEPDVLYEVTIEDGRLKAARPVGTPTDEVPLFGPKGYSASN